MVQRRNGLRHLDLRFGNLGLVVECGAVFVCRMLGTNLNLIRLGRIWWMESAKTEWMTKQSSEVHFFVWFACRTFERNRPLHIITGIPHSSGTEAVRQLYNTYQTASRNRALAVMNAIMGWPQFQMNQPLLPQILRLDEIFAEHRKVAEELPSQMRFAVLLRSLHGQVRTYLNANITEEHMLS